MQEVKVGRNDPCPCGKLKADGKPIKYKKCHGSGTMTERLVTISRSDFIGEPFTQCPNCKRNKFGVFMNIGGRSFFEKECSSCGHKKTYPLPQIRKKIIYLDHFVIDNIVKSLDPEHPKHSTVIKDPFWIRVYSKLDALSRAQLIVCPDSFFHKEESAPTGYFESMRRIYEHFSGGATFTSHVKVAEDQMVHAFDCYLKGIPQSYDFNPENVVMGELHEWDGVIRVSVGAPPKEEEIQELKELKSKNYKVFLETFARWQTEKIKKFEDWYKEETLGYAKGIMISIQNFYERRALATSKYQQTGRLDLNDVLPPLTLDIYSAIRSVAIQNGISEEGKILEKIGEFFSSDEFSKVPIVNIGSLLYASLADQAAKGRTKVPSPGVVADVDMISSILPYCEAVFIDKENAAILMDSRITKRMPYPTKVFSLRNRQEFLDYLDNILTNCDPMHLEFVEQVYGKDWYEPYLSILVHERRGK